MKIGFFDSGLGGLTIMKATAKELPEYDYAYYGDTENLPYGDKSEEEIFKLTARGVEYLFENGCLIVIIACNTASAETARKIQDEFLPKHYPERKVLGIIIPTVETLESSEFDSVSLMGTKRTVDSGKYTKELTERKKSNLNLTELATPELVPLIELGEIEAATKVAVDKIEDEAGDSGAVVLGCTHYTQIKDSLREHFKADKVILSQDEIIPNKLREYLERHPELTSQLAGKGERTIHLTKHRPDYDQVMGQFLGGAYIEE